MPSCKQLTVKIATFFHQFIGACKEPVMVIVTELLLGGTLRKYLLNMRPKCLDKHVAIGFALDIARAMECLHSHGIIHRDLKPGNNLFCFHSPINGSFSSQSSHCRLVCFVFYINCIPVENHECYSSNILYGKTLNISSICFSGCVFPFPFFFMSVIFFSSFNYSYIYILNSLSLRAK